MKYKNVKGSSLSMLDDRVNALIEEGWEPLGSAFTIPESFRRTSTYADQIVVGFAQTMVKNDRVEYEIDVSELFTHHML